MCCAALAKYKLIDPFTDQMDWVDPRIVDAVWTRLTSPAYVYGICDDWLRMIANVLGLCHTTRFFPLKHVVNSLRTKLNNRSWSVHELYLDVDFFHFVHEVKMYCESRNVFFAFAGGYAAFLQHASLNAPMLHQWNPSDYDFFIASDVDAREFEGFVESLIPRIQAFANTLHTFMVFDPETSPVYELSNNDELVRDKFNFFPKYYTTYPSYKRRRVWHVHSIIRQTPSLPTVRNTARLLKTWRFFLYNHRRNINIIRTRTPPTNVPYEQFIVDEFDMVQCSVAACPDKDTLSWRFVVSTDTIKCLSTNKILVRPNRFDFCNSGSRTFHRVCKYLDYGFGFTSSS